MSKMEIIPAGTKDREFINRMNHRVNNPIPVGTHIAVDGEPKHQKQHNQTHVVKKIPHPRHRQTDMGICS